MELNASYMILSEFISELGRDLSEILSKMVLAIVVLAVALVVVRLIGWLVRRVLTIIKLEDVFRRLLRVDLPIYITTLILAVFYTVVMLTTILWYN